MSKAISYDMILPAAASPNGQTYVVCRGYHPADPAAGYGGVGDDDRDPFTAALAQARTADTSRYHCYRIETQADGSEVLVKVSGHDCNPSEALRQALEIDIVLPALRAAESASFDEGRVF